MTRARLAGLIVGVVVGIAAGVGGFTFVYAQGDSYLGNRPEACANCHVMRGHFDGWVKSSHRSVAVCNDCHTPPTFFAKWVTKGLNGFHHSFAFTTGNFPDSIQIGPRNRAVTESACRNCHQDIVQAIDGPHAGQGLDCIRCHRSVGHME